MAIDGTLSHVVIDCHDPEALGAFWADLLGVDVEMRWNQYVTLRPTIAGGPALTFQQVAEPKSGKNRVHLDIAVGDIDTSVAYAVERGATPISRDVEDGVVIQILTDPEGNEFCLVKAG